MLKFYFVFAVFCLFQTSNALGSVKKFYKNLGFSKPKLNGAKKTYSVKQNERVKIIDGPRKGQVGEVGPLNVKNGYWPVYLPYEDEFGNKFKKEMVYLNPKNLMILDKKGYSRLTPYGSKVQLWENDETSDLIMDIPRTIEDAQLNETKYLLEKKEWKTLLKFLLQLDLTKIIFYKSLATALASRMTDDDLKHAIVELYENTKFMTFVQMDSYYKLLRNSAQVLSLAATRKLIEISEQDIFHKSLMQAVKKGDEEMCEFLVRNEANVNFPGRCKNTPLMGSIQLKSVGCFNAILKNENVNVNLYMIAHKSALHFAAELGTGEMCEELIKKKANVDDMGTRINGRYTTKTPLMIASRHGNLDCMKVLLKFNANVELVNEPANENALDIAKRYNKQRCVNCLTTYWEQQKKLLRVVRKVGHKTCPLDAITI